MRAFDITRADGGPEAPNPTDTGASLWRTDVRTYCLHALSSTERERRYCDRLARGYFDGRSRDATCAALLQLSRSLR